MAVTNARVKFLRGLQADLPSTKTDGNVYVAYDERAMYVDYIPAGSSTVQRIRLGDIIEVATINDLPGASDPKSTTALYYVKDGNILAKWDTTAGDWQQINGQSIENIIRAVSWNITTTNGTSTVKLVMLDPQNHTLFESTSKYKIVSANTNALALSSAADAQGIYTLTMRVKDLVETSELGTTTTAYTDDEVPLNLYNYSTGTDASGQAVTKPSQLAATSVLKFIGDGITHVKSNATTGEITIGTTLQMSGSFNANGVFTLGLKDLVTNSTPLSMSVTPTINVGVGTTTPVVFANGIANLPVYTAEQTDTAISNSLKSMNAMTFKGTVGDALDGASVTALPLGQDTVSIGDTYKVVTGGTYTVNTLTTGNRQDAIVGDMFIATSVDNTEVGGYITPSKIRWVYVPSGNEDLSVSLVYDHGTTNKDFYLRTNGANQGLTLRFDQTDLTTSTTGTGANQVVTLSHKAYAAVTATADTNTNAEIGAGTNLYGTETFTAITGVTVSNGHVTSVKTGTFTVGSLRLKTFSGSYTVYNGNTAISGSETKGNGAWLTSTIEYQDNTGSQSSIFKLTSDSLTFIKSDAKLGIDLLWETF